MKIARRPPWAGTLSEMVTQRFWSYVTITDDHWFWTGSCTTKGHGKFNVPTEHGQTTVVAHRIAFILVVGPIKYGCDLHHECSVKNCVRPDHTEELEHGSHTSLTNHERILAGEHNFLKKNETKSLHEHRVDHGKEWSQKLVRDELGRLIKLRR